jgi:hypothetical protein
MRWATERPKLSSALPVQERLSGPGSVNWFTDTPPPRV